MSTPTRVVLRALGFTAALALAGAPAAAQQPIVRGRAVASALSIKVWVPAGSVRLVGWDHDSLLIRGTVTDTSRFFWGGTAGSIKLDVSADADSPPAPADLEVFLPRGAQVSLKTVTASVHGRDVSGWISSVSGAVSVVGESRRLEVETLDGPLTLRLDARWVRARTGNGPLTVEGNIEDIRASSVSGTVTVRNKRASRALFESVTGDIHYVGSFATSGVMEFDSHSGTITLTLPDGASGHFLLTSVAGAIDNGFSADRPHATATGGGQTLTFSRGDGSARIVVRAFKGSIRLRRM